MKFTAAEELRLGEKEKTIDRGKKKKKIQICTRLFKKSKERDEDYTGVSRIHRVNVCLTFA
jgi:hypothetical protein